MAVASALPLALAVLEVDARETGAVKAEGMAFVNDEIIEVGPQPGRRPVFFDGPSVRSLRDRNTAHTFSFAGADQYIAIIGQGRLYDAGFTRPRVLPEQRAVGRRNAGRAGSAQQQDLRDSVDRQ